MTQAQIIGLVIGAIIVLGGGWYLLSGDTTSEMQGKLGAEDAAFSGSFYDLATRGGNYECDTESSGANVDSSGTVYVNGTDLRGDFTTTAAGNTVESHMIKKGDEVYVWSSGMVQGVKMQAPTVTSGGNHMPIPESSGTGNAGTQEYSWNCRATGTDSSRFEVPTDITFMDMAEMGTGMGIPNY